MDQDQKHYELAYLLSPSLPEEEILLSAGKISALIEGAKGNILRVEPPKKRKLAHPIKKQSLAYFGWTSFLMQPREAPALEKKLRQAHDVFRILLIADEPELSRPVTHPPPRSPRAAPQRPGGILREPEPKPEDKLDLEALDRKLEEILGK